MNSELKLSILLVTYNHEIYVRKALDSIAMQDFSGNFEVVIADDCSTDRTMEVIKEFQLVNPNINFNFLQNSSNLGITKNYKRAFKACNGEYIAVLEGDDYWTSPKKMSKQVDFLENNRGCVLTFNRFIVNDMKTRKHNVQPWNISEPFQLITVTDIIKDNFIGNFSTCVYRAEIIRSIDDSLYDLIVYDWMLNIVAAQSGLIGYLPDVMSVYVLHSTGTWSQKAEEEKLLETITRIDEYNNYLEYKYDSEFIEHKNRLLHKLTAIKDPSSLSKKEQLKLKIKGYTPPIIIQIAKLILPPKLIEILKRK